MGVAGFYCPIIEVWVVHCRRLEESIHLATVLCLLICIIFCLIHTNVLVALIEGALESTISNQQIRSTLNFQSFTLCVYVA